MTRRTDGGPAFPAGVPDSEARIGDAGMSLRDWFAGQALIGLTATDVRPVSPNATIASNAYDVADAMLAKRERAS